jgi:hypothetical protein
MQGAPSNLQSAMCITAAGSEHPDVALSLNNLAELLRATNRPAEAEALRAIDRLAEAEPLYRQVLRILAEFRHRTGHEHPSIHTSAQSSITTPD